MSTLLEKRIFRRAVRKLGRDFYGWSEHFALRGEARRRGLRLPSNIHTYTTEAELWALYQIARSLPSGASALELGSYLGASSNFIAAGLDSPGKLYCVDTWRNETMPEGAMDTFNSFLQNTSSLSERITTVRKHTSELSLDDVPVSVSFVFLDGDHSYDGVKLDFDQVLPFISAGGIIAFHDSTAFEGVSKVIGQVLSTGKWQLAGLVGTLLWIRNGEWKNYWTQKQKDDDARALLSESLA